MDGRLQRGRPRRGRVYLCGCITVLCSMKSTMSTTAGQTLVPVFWGLRCPLGFMIGEVRQSKFVCFRSSVSACCARGVREHSLDEHPIGPRIGKRIGTRIAIGARIGTRTAVQYWHKDWHKYWRKDRHKDWHTGRPVEWHENWRKGLIA